MLGLASTSDALGYTSIACWLGAQFPQVVENIQRQSCEGLALPFLANWLLGDISNLIGCILTHQLPFQTWLATYFVFVDMTLLGQYIYYVNIKPPPPPIHPRSRSTTARRMSIDRPRTRYRTLSAVAANVAAAAAALAAQQGEVREHSAHGNRLFHTHAATESSTSRVTRDIDDDEDDGAMAALADSFHSEGGRTIGRKRVSWSKERYGRRAGSVGGHPPLTQSAFLPMTSTDALHSAASTVRGRPETSNVDSTIRHASVASRQGAGLAFLSVFALFSVGTLVQQRSNTGRVLVPRADADVVSHGDVGLGVPHPGLPLDLEDGPIATSLPDLNQENSPNTIYVSTPQIAQNEPTFVTEDTDQERILGRIFAWLCTTLYLTSRLPQIWKNFVRKSVEGLSIYLFVFAFLGNTFYVASILTSPKAHMPLPASREFIKESIPYLLGSGGTLMFDITIVIQSFIYRPKPRRHTRSMSRTIGEEERGLLAGDSLARPQPYNANDSVVHSRDRTSSSHRTTST
ncbi:hypothetical protein VNI00_003234 [Paramarasmius palmivorus]|uniref:Uncharacterized protein n=1 Tax=Paramarasmius palmivorus TaxID=297713 RepID=A0AAW0DUN8_9AGAR